MIKWITTIIINNDNNNNDNNNNVFMIYLMYNTVSKFNELLILVNR